MIRTDLEVSTRLLALAINAVGKNYSDLTREEAKAVFSNYELSCDPDGGVIAHVVSDDIMQWGLSHCTGKVTFVPNPVVEDDRDYICSCWITDKDLAFAKRLLFKIVARLANEKNICSSCYPELPDPCELWEKSEIKEDKKGYVLSISYKDGSDPMRIGRVRKDGKYFYANRKIILRDIYSKKMYLRTRNMLQEVAYLLV
jgi:hypothetical protein